MMIGFKEWALVCRALEEGATSLILRKGGIAEGRAGFQFQHAEFCLFPTLFHEQLAKTRLPADTLLPETQPGQLTIRARAQVEWTQLITDPVILEKLEPFHILQPSVVEERFHYEPKPGSESVPGVHLAFLRVWKATKPWSFPDLPKYGGCRSWVELPEAPESVTWIPALSDEAHVARAAELRTLLQISQVSR